MIEEAGRLFGTMDGGAVALDVLVEVVAGTIIAVLGGLYALSRRRARHRAELARSIADTMKLAAVIAEEGLPKAKGLKDNVGVQQAGFGFRFLAENVRQRFSAVEEDLRAREAEAVRAFLDNADAWGGMLDDKTRRSSAFWRSTESLLDGATAAMRRLGQAKRYRGELARLDAIVTSGARSPSPSPIRSAALSPSKSTPAWSQAAEEDCPGGDGELASDAPTLEVVRRA